MKRHLVVLFASAAMLAACGGGGGGDPAPAPGPTPAPAPAPAVGVVPDAVSSSVATFIGYLMSLVTVNDDTIEPLDVTAVIPPLSDTTEPSATP